MREEADSFLDDEPALSSNCIRNSNQEMNDSIIYLGLSERRVSFLDLLIQNEAHLSDQYIREEVDLIMFAVIT